MKAKWLVVIGVASLAPLVYVQFAAGPAETDIWVAMRPVVRIPLSELQRTRNVTFVFEPRSDEAWRRVVEAWRYPGRERSEPGFIVFAGTNDYWLHPFSSLGISVRATQDGRFLEQLPSANGVYGYSSKSTDYGVHFSPLSSADVRVEIEVKSPVELPAGELLVAPDWGFGSMKGPAIGASIDDNMRDWAPLLALVGMVVVIAVALIRPTA